MFGEQSARGGRDFGRADCHVNQPTSQRANIIFLGRINLGKKEFEVEQHFVKLGPLGYLWSRKAMDSIALHEENAMNMDT